MDTGTGLARNVQGMAENICNNSIRQEGQKVWQYRCQCSSSMATRL